MFVRSLQIRLARELRRGFSTSVPRDADFRHVVIGGGVVGLAVARQLAVREGTTTLLIERNGTMGQETSSRNSEVIHAGLYYGPNSLKTRLCIRGKELLYHLCGKHSIPHHRTGKWIVAQNSAQMDALTKIHALSQTLNVPTHFLTLTEAAAREPDVRAQAGVLESPTTGIIDSHALMSFLLGAFEDAGGDVAVHTHVVGVSTPDHGRSGWTITTRDDASGASSAITTETLINSAGLGACFINNLILPQPRHRTQLYAKGSYYSYSARTPRPATLVYPAPEPGLAGLGTHLTLDLAGQLRFGPDVEWVDSPDDLTVSDADEKMAETVRAIRTYLPTIRPDQLRPDYAGIRPKIGRGSASADGAGFIDFVITKEEGYEGFVNLLGIESPGLTSALAIAEEVERLLYR